ncbi:MAG TPA: carbon starvation protein A, partial [Nitrospiria bacterium]
LILLGIGLGVFALGIRFYSHFLADKIYRLDPAFKTPAHEFNDGVDYVPTNRHILFGHHFTSVAGAAPIVGPAIAMIWGWLPAFLWVVIGTVFAAGVHDFGALVVSVRHKGKSLGTLARDIIGKRARTLFMLIIFFLILMVNAVFALVIARLFIAYPGSVLPVLLAIPLAILVGILIYRTRSGALIPSLSALILLYVFVYLGQFYPITVNPLAETLGLTPLIFWILAIFIYTYFASSLPVWLLLQPRDYINAHQLLVGLAIIFLGVMILHPVLVAPAFNHLASESGAPSFIPFLFVTIACGAISGFHSLVASGTSSKQLDKETDARYVGYIGAVGEGSLALTSILATAAGFASYAAWSSHYSSWKAATTGGIQAYVDGVAHFATGVGIPAGVGVIFASVVVISFAATSLDTSMRLQRYIIAELGEDWKMPVLQNKWVASFIAVALCITLALSKDGGKGGLLLWPLFGATNQLLAGLALLVVTLWLWKQKRNFLPALIPMVFLLLMTGAAMLLNVKHYFLQGDWFLVSLSGVIFTIVCWLILESFQAVRIFKNGRRTLNPATARNPSTGSGS